MKKKIRGRRPRALIIIFIVFFAGTAMGCQAEVQTTESPAQAIVQPTTAVINIPSEGVWEIGYAEEIPALKSLPVVAAKSVAPLGAYGLQKDTDWELLGSVAKEDTRLAGLSLFSAGTKKVWLFWAKQLPNGFEIGGPAGSFSPVKAGETVYFSNKKLAITVYFRPDGDGKYSAAYSAYR